MTQLIPEPQQDSPPRGGTYWLGLLCLAVVLIGIYWRFWQITTWPVRFPTMLETSEIQYANACTARTHWLMRSDWQYGTPEWLWLEYTPGRAAEPPVIPFLTAVGYRLLGEERPWIAVILTSVFWLGGGWFLFDLVRRMVAGTAGALVSLAFYLLTPFGIVISRSFQCESVMVFGFLVALWCLLRAGAGQGWKPTLLSGILCGLALLSKPGIMLLPFLAGYVGLAVTRRGFRAALLGPQSWVFILLASAPSFAYSLRLEGQFGIQFQPQLLLESAYYVQAWRNVEEVVGWAPLLLALMGAGLMARDTRGGLLGVGLLLGFVGYSGVFTFATMTHDYYLVPLIPLVAINLGPLAQRLSELVPWKQLHPATALACCVGALAACVCYSWGVARELETGVAATAEHLQKYQEVSQVVKRGARAVCLAEESAFPLIYHSWTMIDYHWAPSWEAEQAERYGFDDELPAGRANCVKSPKRTWDAMIQQTYPTLFVVTDVEDFKLQPALQELLESRYILDYASEQVVVYDLEHSTLKRPFFPGRKKTRRSGGDGRFRR